MRRSISRTRERGATRVEFLDIVTAIIVLAVLVWAASRQFPTYRSAEAPPPATAQAH